MALSFFCFECYLLIYVLEFLLSLIHVVHLGKMKQIGVWRAMYHAKCKWDSWMEDIQHRSRPRPYVGFLSKRSFYKLFNAWTATEANRDILFINCAPLIARSHQLPIHMDIKPSVLNLLRLISFNGLQQREVEVRTRFCSCLFMPCVTD